MSDPTVCTVGLQGLSSSEIIMTRLIQQKDDRSMDRRSAGNVSFTIAGRCGLQGANLSVGV